MKLCSVFIFLLPLLLRAQEVIVNLDSFPTFVKSVSIKSFIVGDAFRPDSLTREFTSTYMELGPDGNWTTRIDVFADGDVSFDSTWYDNNTRTKFLKRRNSFEPSLTSTAYNANGTVNSVFFDAEQRDDISTKYDYNKQGRLTRITEVFTDQQKRIDFTYNKTGVLIRRSVSYGSVLAKDPDVESEYEYSYNATGQLTRVIELYYGAKDVVRLRDTVWYIHDANGRVVQQNESRQHGSEKRNYTYAYDSAGRMIEKTYSYRILGGDSGFVHNKWEYDVHGYLSYSFEEGDNYAAVFTWKVTYNERGLPINCYYSTDAEVLYYRWEYEDR